MKFRLLLSGMLLLSGIANAQSGSYSALTIPDSLRKDADAVIREDYRRFKVKSVDNAYMEVHMIVTIFNENASEYQTFAEWSDKFHILDDAEVKVYNAMGKELNKYTKKEMRTVAYGDGLVEDGKMTYFTVTAPVYPITIEQTYTIKYKGMLDYPDNSILSPGVSTEHFLYSVEVPTNMGLRYKVLNYSANPVKEQLNEMTTYTWDLKNLKAVKREANSGPTDRYFPVIRVAPNKFSLAGYAGDMTSWKNFGQWSYDLIGKDNQLSEKSATIIRDLVKNAKSDDEKMRIIYRYLQRNMRYVSIQLGIGGFKPFSADFVQEKKYGDCKALSNYMQAALQTVGIKSYYAIINARTNATPAMEDFPSSPFNHVILCVPQKNDTIWLECTSSTADFGVLGDFTENRKALLVTENGGVLVSTPGSRAAANTFSTHTNVEVSEDGSGSLSTVLKSSGEFKQEQLYSVHQKSADEMRKYFIKGLEWKTPDRSEIVAGNRDETPYITSAKMHYDQFYIFKAGSKMFLPSRVYNFFDETINDNSKRKQDYFFSYPYIKTDTVSFSLPKGYLVEELPKGKAINNAFAKYNSRYEWDPATGKVNVYATIEIIRHVIASKDYPSLMQFKKEVDDDISQRIIVKKEG
jgi:transglutaminase-like putative cysteine protease